MPLFQNSVLKKYLAHLDPAAVQSGYAAYTAYFHHPQIRENIRNAKEEQFQEGFLRELFVKILGYTINPEPDFNLTTELKNIKDSKKTDGAILKDGKALAVIELKGTDTKDLDKIRDQAFNYKNNQPECVYVLTSNFERMRFYIDNAVDFVEFNVLAMAAEDFRLLWLLLHRDQLLGGIPKKIKEESLLAEEQVTKQLYADYSAFKQELWQDMVAHNPGEDELTLYKKSQKLLDRFLFIFFAEDKGLLPPNSIMEIVAQWKHLGELDEYRPLYERFRKYFGYLNTGRVVPGKAEIHAYNGGLFAPDAVLDGLTISDAVLEKHVRKLTEYDFESEVDTNILGHIFEHSLNDIENVRAQLAGQEVDKSKTKRKRDGVFYTPKYITKYIVDNTLGRLCREKKEEIEIVDEEFARGKVFKTKEAEQKRRAELKEKLTNYRNWLMQLAICDPACGSGAFLNQVLEFLMAEHHYLDELESMLFGSSIVFPNVEKHILENNIFGVDINEESVEIARLSLWLRTAKKGRKLSSLNANIKVGNSLIDDPTVAGDLAFNWAEQFPQVFAKGGFDVVVGNPPYLRVQGLRTNFEEESKFYEKHFASATGRFDIYVLFIERAFSLISKKGKVSFILPHKFLVSDFGSGIRLFLSKNKAIELLLHFGSEMVFQDASTYTCILNLSKENSEFKYAQVNPKEIFDSIEFGSITFDSLDGEKWSLQNSGIENILKKLNQQKYKAIDVFQWISQGVVSVGDDIFLLKGKINGSEFTGFSDRLGKEITIEADVVKPLLKGEDVKRYAPIRNDYFVVYPHEEVNGKTVPFEEEEFIKRYPKAYSYMLPFKQELIEKKIRYKTNPRAWYSLHRSREISLFQSPKILTPETSLGGNLTLDNAGYFHNTQVYFLLTKEDFDLNDKYLLGVLNSSVFWFFLQNTGAVLRGGYFRFKTKYLEPFPIPVINYDLQLPIVNLVDSNLEANVRLDSILNSFIQLTRSKFSIDKPSTKLQNWPELDFKGFLGELAKAKVKLSLSEEAEWMAYFNEQKAKAQALQSEITRIDKEIDALVYELYGLTEEEIRIVEGGE
ncbi:Eco57I restriction-modification methylase domain-containing protein [Mariniradius sediminis]|uniref:site-specific DNA-methyltransferase (adenine-specific) n=1 Tax=Mariniradius sediminis TaxID=2909237 RepID=A0ABS9BUW6_9BACT|nr:N-6 DNA methylase [Mariniradius sediminis]MCF1751855.1 N-6 DNA methylase [Mariniradius sediminis]